MAAMIVRPESMGWIDAHATTGEQPTSSTSVKYPGTPVSRGKLGSGFAGKDTG